MNEARRLAAWLDANAKHLPMDEAAQMHKAANHLRFMNDQLAAQKDLIKTADGLIVDMRRMLEAVGELPKQETA